MKKIGLLVVLVAGLWLVSACAQPTTTTPTTPSTPQSTQPTTPAAPATQTTTTAAADGEKLYQTNCVACHGANGAGGLKLGDVTAPDIRAAALQNVYRGDTNLIKRSILEGKDEEGKDLNAAMPRQMGKLSDADVDAIIRYLQSLR
ncbi:MAG: cytochrome c [Chloroflexi bacterium]|nr:cytochrome c [Chloroflexota bacterium]